MKTLKLILLLCTLSSAVLLTDVAARSGQTQKKDTTARQANVNNRDSVSRKGPEKDQNRKRTHNKNMNDRNTDKK